MDATDLDADELLQLALRHIADEDLEGALIRLKRLVALDAGHANGTYLLGSVHAQLGLLERAADEIGRACELEPELWTAHFQLGLLRVGLGDGEGALAAWAPLEQLAEDDLLRVFGGAMTLWLTGESEAALAAFDRGLAALDPDDPLRADMTAMRAAAASELEADAANVATTPTPGSGDGLAPAASPAARRALLTRYEDGESTD